MTWGGLTAWAFFSTLVLYVIIDGSRALGLTRMDLPFILGTLFTSHRDRAKPIGFLIHVLNGWIFALFYLVLIRETGFYHWWFGMVIGIVHSAFILIVVSEILPSLHPRMASEEHGPDPTRLLEPPGPFALNYGKQTPIVTIAAHLVYGGMLGLVMS